MMDSRLRTVKRTIAFAAFTLAITWAPERLLAQTPGNPPTDQKAPEPM
jgi:hypothetical protein